MEIIKQSIAILVFVWILTGIIHILSISEGKPFDTDTYILAPIFFLLLIVILKYILIPFFDWANKD